MPAGTPPAVTVLRLDDVAELEKHVAEWDDLARDALEPNVFYESWMLLPALRAFGAGEHVFVLLVYLRQPHRNGGRPLLCGLFPLRRQRYRRLPLHSLSCWQYEHAYLGVPLVRRGTADLCLQRLFDWLGRHQRESIFESQQATGDGVFFQQLLEFADKHGLRLQVTDCHTRALLLPQASAEEYLEAALSGDRRKKLRKAEKQLAAVGPVEYRQLQSGDDLEAWLQKFLEVEQSGWKGEAATAINCNAADRDFFLAMVRGAFARQRLVMLALHCGGRPVAFLCDLLAGEGAFAFKVAYDDAFARYSPGALLEVENIRRVHARPKLRWVDSCTAPGPALVRSLWTDRRIIQTVLVPIRPGPGPFFLAALPLLRWLRRTVRRFFRR